MTTLRVRGPRQQEEKVGFVSSTVSRRGRLFSLLVMATLVAGLAPLASPASVAAVVLARPDADGPGSGDTVTGNPVFAWTAVSSAVEVPDRGERQIAGFSPLVSGFPVDTLNLRYAPPAELPLGTLYWRVAALDAGNALGTYAYGDFTKAMRRRAQRRSPGRYHAALNFPTDPLLFTLGRPRGRPVVRAAGGQRRRLHRRLELHDQEHLVRDHRASDRRPDLLLAPARGLRRHLLRLVADRDFSSVLADKPALELPADDATTSPTSTSTGTRSPGPRPTSSR